MNAFANNDYVEGQRARVRKAELEWLRAVLGASLGRWTIVVQHQPVFPVVKSRQYPKMRATVEALYDQYQVDLVLQGHDHVYARTHTVIGGDVAGPECAGNHLRDCGGGLEDERGQQSSRTPHGGAATGHPDLPGDLGRPRTPLLREPRSPTAELVDAFQLMKTAATGTVYVNKAPGLGAAKQEH